MTDTDETEAAQEATERLHEENPFEGGQLVIYSAEAEWAEQEPQHENLEQLGVVSWSLWVRFEEDKVELPIVGEASWHIWYSLSVETFNPDPADPVSDAFIRSVVQMVDEDVGEGWGDVEEKIWDQMLDLEKYVFHLVRDGFLKMEAAEPALIIDWCQNNQPEVAA